MNQEEYVLGSMCSEIVDRSRRSKITMEYEVRDDGVEIMRDSVGNVWSFYKDSKKVTHIIDGVPPYPYVSKNTHSCPVDKDDLPPAKKAN